LWLKTFLSFRLVSIVGGIRMTQKFSSRKLTALYYASAVLIIAFSVFYYLPCFFPFLNSDHAIHALMTYDFQLPRDYYYMGQNRLGSLLPMVSFLLNKVIHAHPLYVCSVVHYLFLLLPYLIIEKWISDIWLKLSLLILIFLPFNSYVALLYIGHPYSQQLFCGTLCLLYFIKLHQLLLRSDDRKVSLLKFSSYGILCVLFYFLGVWVSEFNAILLLIPLIYLVKYRKVYFKKLGYRQTVLVVTSAALISFSLIKFYQYTKAKAVPDDTYNNPFITDKASILKEFDFMKQKMAEVFQFNDPNKWLDNTIYFLLFAVIVFLVVNRKKMKEAPATQTLSMALLIVSCISIFLLFFSFWNFRSEYCPRYYIPVYLMLAVTLLFYLDRLQPGKYVYFILFLLISFHCTAYTYLSLIRVNASSPLHQYDDFSTLPKGTLIADYWETYLYAAISPTTIHPLTFQEQTCRTWNERDRFMSEKNIYFLNNYHFTDHHFSDTIVQYGYSMVNTGVKYKLKNEEVMLYRIVSRKKYP
jgi:hypothetical protein